MSQSIKDEFEAVLKSLGFNPKQISYVGAQHIKNQSHKAGLEEAMAYGYDTAGYQYQQQQPTLKDQSTKGPAIDDYIGKSPLEQAMAFGYDAQACKSRPIPVFNVPEVPFDMQEPVMYDPQEEQRPIPVFNIPEVPANMQGPVMHDPQEERFRELPVFNIPEVPANMQGLVMHDPQEERFRKLEVGHAALEHNFHVFQSSVHDFMTKETARRVLDKEEVARMYG